ncbi:serine/threonine protein kinase [Pseudonocardia eucalypti]|nr:serine/threonine protein kinase [Pseudonocardia eucalypti]
MTATPDAAPLVLAERYRLEERIGAGSMGAVWRATDERLNRTVAVKQLLLRPGMPGFDTVAAAGYEEAKQRILREGRLAARLQHPHTIAVYDVVLHEEAPWLVMEYLSSRTLNELLIAEAPVDPREVARIGAQIADGLAAAHAAGIVHRDIKPANVLIGHETAIVKITDFGVSRAADDVQLTRTGLIAGTPAYLAPEIARGQPPTPASDVFALGATLYTAVQGEPPFGLDDNAYALLYRVAAGKVTAPERAGTLTDPLMRMLHPDPAERPTAEQARAELSAVAAGRAAEARGGDTKVDIKPISPRAGASAGGGKPSGTLGLPADPPSKKPGAARFKLPFRSSSRSRKSPPPGRPEAASAQPGTPAQPDRPRPSSPVSDAAPPRPSPTPRDEAPGRSGAGPRDAAAGESGSAARRGSVPAQPQGPSAPRDVASGQPPGSSAPGRPHRPPAPEAGSDRPRVPAAAPAQWPTPPALPGRSPQQPVPARPKWPLWGVLGLIVVAAVVGAVLAASDGSPGSSGPGSSATAEAPGGYTGGPHGTPTAAELTAFVQDYYRQLPGDPAAAWAMLGENARRASGDFAGYQGFYRSLSSVGFVEGPTAVNGRTVRGTLRFVPKNGRETQERYEFTVVPGPDGKLIMSSFSRR